MTTIPNNNVRIAPVLDRYYAHAAKVQLASDDEVNKYSNFWKRNRKIIIPAGMFATALTGAGFFVTTGSGVRKWIDALRGFDSRKIGVELRETFKDSEFLKQSGSLMSKVKYKIADGLTTWLNFDKIKDRVLLKSTYVLPGKENNIIARFSKSSAGIQKTLAKRRWERLAEYAKVVEPEKAHLFERLSGEFAGRAGKIEAAVAKQLQNFDTEYFARPEHAAKTMVSGKDMIRGGWKECTDEFADRIDSVIKADDIKDEILLRRFREAREGEIDSYAGRLLDLEFGGGVIEVLSPPLLAAMLMRNTFKGKDLEEKRNNFLKGGGVAFVGAIGTWMYTMLRGVNGPKVLALTAASGLTFDIVGKELYKYLIKKEAAEKAS